MSLKGSKTEENLKPPSLASLKPTDATFTSHRRLT